MQVLDKIGVKRFIKPGKAFVRFHGSGKVALNKYAFDRLLDYEIDPHCKTNSVCFGYHRSTMYIGKIMRTSVYDRHWNLKENQGEYIFYSHTLVKCMEQHFDLSLNRSYFKLFIDFDHGRSFNTDFFWRLTRTVDSLPNRVGNVKVGPSWIQYKPIEYRGKRFDLSEFISRMKQFELRSRTSQSKEAMTNNLNKYHNMLDYAKANDIPIR